MTFHTLSASECSPFSIKRKFYNSGDIIPESSIFNMSQQQKKKDTTARDIARKLKQIRKYVDELQALGVKQCYVYTSVRTGGLYVYGHEDFTRVFEKHHSETMESLCSVDYGDAVKETYILPKLPGPLDAMNTLTIKSVICNLVRDLDLDWNGPKPDWWPPFVPFQSPWKTTDIKTCILTKGLRNAVHALYQSRGLDANTYIEGSGSEDQDQECEDQDQECDADNQEEPPRHHPFEFEREDSILPPGSPCARMMPSPRSLPAPKTPSSDLSSPYQTSTPAPLRLSTPKSHRRYEPYQIPNHNSRPPLTPGRNFTPLALRRQHRQHKPRNIYSPSHY